MRFGVREICDVVLRAKAIQKIGNKVFYKDEPVLYFDSLKTSSLEGAATTVYAQGGRGNSRLIAWEGERTVTFTMEDALISPAGFSILSGAGLISADNNNKIKVHTTERTNKIEFIPAGQPFYDNGIKEWTEVDIDTESNDGDPWDNIEYYICVEGEEEEEDTYIKVINDDITVSYPHGQGSDPVWSYDYDEETYDTFYYEYVMEQPADYDQVFIYVSQKPYQPQGGNYQSNFIYIMRVYNDEIVTEPFIPFKDEVAAMVDGEYKGLFRLIIASVEDEYTAQLDKGWCHQDPEWVSPKLVLDDNCVALVDYYVEKAGVQQIDITPDKFGGNYYLEASTLFRDTNGVDLPAEFIIPNCKIQSNFTFSMASSGDPSTFTFTMDAFPDYTRFDPTKKVLASIQIIDATTEAATKTRTGSTGWSASDSEDVSREKTWTGFEPAND